VQEMLKSRDLGDKRDRLGTRVYFYGEGLCQSGYLAYAQLPSIWVGPLSSYWPCIGLCDLLRFPFSSLFDFELLFYFIFPFRIQIPNPLISFCFFHFCNCFSLRPSGLPDEAKKIVLVFSDL
jgi:hypothetical protein